jgi:triosephosphate isomerase (TIM)
MRRAVVAGNWKMHGSTTSIGQLLDELRPLRVADVDVIVFPPMTYLASAVSAMKTSAIAVGAQNIHFESEGAYTGEVSAEMIADVGATHVLVGHSERRVMFGETDEVVIRKFAAARRVGLTPILCVGESLVEREAGRAEATVGKQLDAVMQTIDASALRNSIVAYEPVWAIGTGRSATPGDAQQMHRSIRARIRARFGAAADDVRIVYGGSIKSANAAELFAGDDVDGGLVGGASLDARQFVEICKAV